MHQQNAKRQDAQSRKARFFLGRGAGEVWTHLDPSDSPLRPYIGTNVTPGSLGAIVRAYKSSVAYRIHALRGSDPPPIWQRNYYEHIIRNEHEHRLIADYIFQNPAYWQNDDLHPWQGCKI
jgi:hypothetical protein